MPDPITPTNEEPETSVALGIEPIDASATGRGLPDLTPPLRASSTLTEAVAAFHEYMVRKGFSDNTIKAFANDLKFLADYLGRDTKLYHVSSENLDGFLPWLSDSRSLEFSAKTQARRITTLKVFFGWLHGIGIIGSDPAEPMMHVRAQTPLPVILRDTDISRMLRIAQDGIWDRQKPDVRPYLLVSLLLQTGIKKAECARLHISDLDVSRPQSPTLTVRYAEARHAHKNRTLALNAAIVPALQQYRDQYKPSEFLFECTPRNLEYVLEELGEKAGVRYVQVGFEALRWTCAVRDYRNNMPEDVLRQKMGLSKISWRETREKIFILAGR